MRDHSTRVDWDDLRVNNLTSKPSYIFNIGDQVTIRLGRRISSIKSKEIIKSLTDESLKPYLITPNRSKNYSKRRQKQSKLINMGDKLCLSGHTEEADKYYIKAEGLNTDTNWPNVRRANLLRLQGDCDEAIKICEWVLRSTPNPYASLCLSIAHYWAGSFDIAIENINKCLKWKPNYCNALLWKARLMLHYNRYLELDKLLEARDTLLKKRKTKFKIKKKIYLAPLILHWLSLYNQGKKQKNNRMLSKIFIEIDKLLNDNKIEVNHSLPLASLILYFMGKEVNSEIKIGVKNIIGKFTGLKYDLIMWGNVLPWKDIAPYLNQDKFINIINP